MTDKVTYDMCMIALHQGHMALWGWLADNPDKKKDDWPSWSAWFGVCAPRANADAVCLADTLELSAYVRNLLSRNLCFSCAAAQLTIEYRRRARTLEADVTDPYDICCSSCPLRKSAWAQAQEHPEMSSAPCTCLSGLYSGWSRAEGVSRLSRRRQLAVTIQRLAWEPSPMPE